jgi:Zn-dependent protease with chaperone function
LEFQRFKLISKVDFFERQAQAHRHTKLLILYFVLAVASLIAAVYLVSVLLFNGHYYLVAAHRPELSLWNPKLLLVVAAATLTVIGIGTAFKTVELSRGGSAVAMILGGRLIPLSTTGPNERKLLNVVEEIAIAAGVPVPQVFLTDKENGINAFAAGHSTSDAVISVTQGAIKLLTRDELQGALPPFIPA